MSISEFINQYGIGYYIAYVVIGIAILLAIVVFLFIGFCVFSLLVSKALEFNESLDFSALRYIQDNFDKFAKDTANNSVICNKLKCQKSAKDSSRK